MQCNCTTANRFSSNYIYADIAQLVVHRIRNPKVASSILAISSKKNNRLSRWGAACFVFSGFGSYYPAIPVSVGSQ